MNGNVAFGAVNQVESAALTALPEFVTDLDNIKNHERARLARCVDLSADTIIEGTHDAVQYADYFALIGSNLQPNATIKLELFATDVSTVDLLQMDAQPVGKLIPLPLWRAGVDKYNVRTLARGDDPLTLWFDNRIGYQKFKLTIAHGYIVDETAVYNNIPTQDEFGVVSLEAEDAEITNLGASQWAVATDATASDGESLHKTGGGFYTAAGAGPSFKFKFSAAQTGTHKAWVRVKAPAVTGNDSFHLSLDGANTTTQNVVVDGVWRWIEAATVALTDGTDHTLIVSAREDNLYIDKVVILPNADPAPTGTGPAASTYGVVGSTDSVDIRMLHMGSVWQPERNYSYGAPYRPMTEPETGKTTSGHHVLLRQQREVKEMSMSLEKMTNSDALRMLAMRKERAGRPVFFSARPKCAGWAADELTYLGRIIDTPTQTHRFENHHETTITITEA